MSTRAQLVIRDSSGELWFYRHSDGYPSGVSGSLTEFLLMLKAGHLRPNVEQGAGWLILIGAHEYSNPYPETQGGCTSWKVGAWEPCSCRGLHGDTEWLYDLDLGTATLRMARVSGGKRDSTGFIQFDAEVYE